MSSKIQDLLGDLIDSTSMQPDDLDPLLTPQGLAALVVPKDEDISDDTEEDDAFEALREDLSPGEASNLAATMRPLSKEENRILDETPMLDDLLRVDDPEQEDFIIAQSRKGYKGLDDVLDDAIYGDTMNHEERMERNDTDDSGFSIRSAFRKAGKGVYRAGSKGVGRITRLAKRFVPSRDAKKAKLVQQLHRKLTVEHANWLGVQDQRAGLPLKPRPEYLAVAKLWATNEIKKGGLPTKYVVGRAEILGADIVGGEIMGAWWNPFSWFSERSQVIVNQTQGARSPVGPDGQPIPEGEMPPPEGLPEGQYPEPSEPAYDAEAEGEEDMSASGDMIGIEGEDSFLGFATEILGSSESLVGKTKAPTKEDQLVAIAVAKLRNRQPLSAGELAVLASLAKAGHPRARRVCAVLLSQGAAVSGDESGAWLHKLNPAYWFKSSEEKKLTDVERQRWIENAELRKKLAKRQEVLTQAEKAKAATEAVAQAQAQAAATEAQLKAIEASLKGELIKDLKEEPSKLMDISVGHEKPTSITAVVLAALEKSGKKAKAKALYGKIAKGESLSPDELKEARGIAKTLQKIKVVHGDLVETDPALAMLHGAFVGACVLGGIAEARTRNERLDKAASILGKRLAASDPPLTPTEKKVAARMIEETDRLRGFTRALVNGSAFVGLDNACRLKKCAFIGAVKAMSEEEKKMLSAMLKLAKAGNPRAIEAIRQLKQSGEIAGGDFVGGDSVGLSLKSAFKYATAPVWLPAYGAYKGAKWTGKKLGIIKKGKPSAEQVRLSKMKAAAKRRAAAEARARAADAETEAELRAQQSIAEAADAEAEAADAQALAQEAAMKTREIEADPSQAQAADEAESDSSGEFVGSWTAYVGYDPKVKDPFDPGSPMMKKALKEKEIIKKASADDATGMKIRAGAKIYKKAKAGDKKAQASIRTMVAKAKKGDKQAILDTQAVQAGRLAVLAKKSAKKREAIALARQAKRQKVIAFQKKLEARAANKLARMERKRELSKLAKVERKAATGNPRARAYVAKQVAAAKQGDKKACSRVEKLKLVQNVRKAAPTRREQRNLVAAQKLVEKARKGDPKAVRQIRVIEAAAAKGNPNAKRAWQRLLLAGAVITAVTTGAIVYGKKKDKKAKPSRTTKAQALATAKSKKAAGTATREELAAGARAAQDLGDRKTASELAVAASQAPSATEQLKKTAAVVAAKETGSTEAKAAIAANLEAAKKGDPEGIKKTSKVIAVQTIDDLNKGRPISQTMQDAINLNERIQAKDPSAIATAKEITEAATAENPAPEATLAAATLSAAAITSAALAAKPKAKAEYLAKVNPPLAPAEKSEAEAKVASLVAKANEGTITPEEGVEGAKLAVRLGKPKVAAEIAAKAPPLDTGAPLSSLPDMPLTPITGVMDLIRETLRAITFSTRDPLANYRGGIAARAKTPAAVEPVSASGWSPFSFFKSFARSAPIIAPATGIVASAASLAMALDARKRTGQQAPAPAPAPAAPAAPAPAATVTAPATPVQVVQGEEMQGAAKKKAVEPPLPAEALARARKEAEEGILPPMPSSSLGKDKTFPEYMKEAVKAKKMSKSDFNKAIEIHLGKKATKEAKTASGEKVLAFLAKKGVKVE